MKTFFLFVLLVVPALVFADNSCIEAKPDSPYNARFLYLGKNHWLTVVGKRLLELKDDKLVSSVAYPEPLKIMCGSKGRVIATTLKTVSEWREGKLYELPLRFKGDVIRSDGDTVYSTISTPLGFALYANKNGEVKQIVEQKGYSGSIQGGFFIWSNDDKRQNLVFQNGKLVSKSAIPGDAYLNRVFDYQRCKGQGLHTAASDFYVKSRFGIQTKHIEGPIVDIDYPKGCENYVFLLNDFSYSKGALWSLKPGKNLKYSQIRASCPVDGFAANDDGSLYYRCNKQFFYKNKGEAKDVLLGEAVGLKITEGLNDQWLSSTKDGTLLAYLPEAKPKEMGQACFVRLTPEKLIDIGCY